jgi:hypothetical protein
MFAARFTDRLQGDDLATRREVAGRLPAWARSRAERFAVIHGDYRLDNQLFPHAGDEVAAVDARARPPSPRRRLLPRRRPRSAVLRHARTRHRRRLPSISDRSRRRRLPLRAVFRQYRFAALQGPLITGLGCAYGTPSERGDAMFLAMAHRSCTMIRELSALSLL